ncbi:iron-containing redox enzyme family protein, partial [Pseudomonas reactans]
QRQVKVGGEWSKQLFKCFLAEKLESRGEAVQDSLSLIQSAGDPQLMLKLLLMQHAVDFLPESSHMVRFA